MILLLNRLYWILLSLEGPPPLSCLRPGYHNGWVCPNPPFVYQVVVQFIPGAHKADQDLACCMGTAGCPLSRLIHTPSCA